MKKITVAIMGSAVFATFTPALANDDKSAQVVAERRDYSDGFGELNTVTGEFLATEGDTTIVIEPRWGERETSVGSWDAVGIGADVYHRFSQGVSTRTRLAVAQDEPVFANIDVAQDVTVRLAPALTGTVGARYARFFGDQDVYFVSGGPRYYFKGGSISYRLSYIEPKNRDEIWAHMVQLTVNDGADSRGKTQLWLSAGETSLDDAVFVGQASGKDYAAYLRRYQPISGQFDLIANVGIASYDRPGGRVTAPTFGVGIRVGM